MLGQFILSLFFMLLAGCWHHTPPSSSTPERALHTKQTRHVGAFTRVDVKGNINISLHSGYSKPRVILKGALIDLKQVSTHVSGSTLMIKVGEGYPKHGGVTAIVQGGRLSRFVYQGAGTITGTKLYSKRIDFIIDNKGSTRLGGDLGVQQLDIKGDGHVDLSGIRSHNLNMTLGGDTQISLKGVANVSSLCLEDKARVTLNWVNSKAMWVRAYDNASITLAGIADKLDLKLCDRACFNGRYLRVNRAFVKTYGHSRAEISAVNRQHTLASDNSDIHFYTIPELRTDFLAFNGAVLDMRDLNLPYLQAYDEYNKTLPQG